LLSGLLHGLEDGYAPMAEMVMEQALPALGKGVVSEVVAGLDINGKVADIRRLWVVCKLDPAAGVELCRKAIKEGSVLMRVKALELLPEVADKTEAEKVGLELCQDKSAEVRAAAVLALRVSGSKEALEAALAATKDKSSEVQAAAATALRALPNAETTPRLLQEMATHLKELDELKVPKKAKAEPAKKGAKAAKGAKKAGPSEADKVKAQRNKVIIRVQYLLSIVPERHDAHRAEAARAVLSLVEHKEPSLRESAYIALGGIGGAVPEVLQALVEVLKDGKSYLRRTAATALRRLKPEEREPAFDLIVKLAKDPKTEANVRWEAINMLPAHWKGHEETVLSLLRSILKEKAREAQQVALNALGEIGPPARVTLPEALPILVGRSSFYYGASQNFLTKVDPEGEQAIPALIEAIRSRKDREIWQALAALQAYGPKARAAIPEVTVLLDHKEYSVQHWARATLSALEGN
jgi:HEAT repeat protein